MYPTGGALSLLKPDILLLVIIYWSLTIPNLFGLKNVIIIGLLADTLKGLIIGQHVVTFSIINYLANFFSDKFKLYSSLESMLLISFLLFTSKCVFLLIEWHKIESINVQLFFYSVIILSFLWPLVLGLMSKLVRKFRAEILKAYQ